MTDQSRPSFPSKPILRTEVITFRCTRKERALLVAYARQCGVPVFEVARHALLQAIARYQARHDDQKSSPAPSEPLPPPIPRHPRRQR